MSLNNCFDIVATHTSGMRKPFAMDMTRHRPGVLAAGLGGFMSAGLRCRDAFDSYPWLWITLTHKQRPLPGLGMLTYQDARRS